MTSPEAFVAGLAGLGITLVSGVPCSYLSGPIRLLPAHPTIGYAPAANEGAALGVAAGASLAGGRGAVLLQNSGFGNLVNPLTSLVLPYDIPVLAIVSMRGWPVASAGEPQHHWMGRVVEPWLASLGIEHRSLVPGGPALPALLADLQPALSRGEPAFLLVGKGGVSNYTDAPADPPPADRPSRDELVQALLAHIGSGYLLSTTGYLSRALFNAGDRPRNFYMQGSMGHVAALALGTALTHPGERVVALDGDGSALMHLGTLSTIGNLGPGNLTHIIFDNRSYESTGCQPTTSPTTDFPAIARGAGYRTVLHVTSTEDLQPTVHAALTATGPVMVVVDGRVGGATGERASNSLLPSAMTARFAAEAGMRA